MVLAKKTASKKTARVKVKTLPASKRKVSTKDAKKIKGGGNTVYIAGASGGVWKTSN